MAKRPWQALRANDISSLLSHCPSSAAEVMSCRHTPCGIIARMLRAPRAAYSSYLHKAYLFSGFGMPILLSDIQFFWACVW